MNNAKVVIIGVGEFGTEVEQALKTKGVDSIVKLKAAKGDMKGLFVHLGRNQNVQVIIVDIEALPEGDFKGAFATMRGDKELYIVLVAHRRTGTLTAAHQQYDGCGADQVYFRATKEFDLLPRYVKNLLETPPDDDISPSEAVHHVDPQATVTPVLAPNKLDDCLVTAARRVPARLVQSQEEIPATASHAAAEKLVSAKRVPAGITTLASGGVLRDISRCLKETGDVADLEEEYAKLMADIETTAVMWIAYHAALQSLRKKVEERFVVIKKLKREMYRADHMMAISHLKAFQAGGNKAIVVKAPTASSERVTGNKKSKAGKEIIIDEKVVYLTRKQLLLFGLLMKNAGDLVGYEVLEGTATNRNFSYRWTLQMAIKTLRRRLSESCSDEVAERIVNVKDQGYYFDVKGLSISGL